MADKPRPLHQFRSGAISVSVWPQQTKDGNKVFYSANAQRAYTKDDGKTWEHTDSFSRDDLPVVALLMQQAWAFICRKEDEAKK